MQERRCEICSVLLERRRTERLQGFKLRRTCSLECGNRLRSKTETRLHDKFGTSVCLVCEKPLERREYASGKLEPRNKFEKGRLTCSKDCCNKLRSIRHKQRGDKRVQAAGLRFCNLCGQELKRRESEHPNDFCRRVTCGRSCRSSSERDGDQRAERADSAKRTDSIKCVDTRVDPPKCCLACNQPMLRRENEQLGPFMKRKTCSPECTSKYMSAIRSKTKIVPGRACLVCGATLVRKGYEMPNVFAKRKTCDRVCNRTFIKGRVRLFDFYGAQLSREVLGVILGLTKTGVRHRFP